MTRNRLIQLAAVLIAVGCVVGSALVAPRVEEKRRELQLTFSQDLRQQMPAQVAVATAALGSFRGLAVDVMWYRLEMLKREGKFHEANTLSQWITNLQPRFPQVWSFMAWNMAYNISVATFTPDERMNWVNKGIDLLREKGIPYNPHAIRLYRELGWIFFHKVGQYSDDQHWYYKIRLAEEWQQLLGNEAVGGSTQQAIDAFVPIAEAYDAYFNQRRPTRQAMALYERLARTSGLEERLAPLERMPLSLFAANLRRIEGQLQREAPSLARQLEPLVELIQGQIARASTPPGELFAAAEPEAAALLGRFRSLGWDDDEQLLRALGRMLMVTGSSDAALLGLQIQPPDDPRLRQLFDVVVRQDEPQQAPLQRVLAYLRAKVISQNYYMDPNWMLHLLEKYGPVDWRNAAAHSLYWSSMGVYMAESLRNKKDVDLLNTIRQVIHSLQTLSRTGRTNYDPISRYIDQLPDPRFIPAYEKAVEEGGEEVEKAEWGSGTAENFQAGYENFLISAVVASYLYGDQDQARAYYRKLRDKFADLPHNQQSKRYFKPLDDFVTAELTQDLDQMYLSRQFIDALLERGVTEGLANNRLDVYQRFRDVAMRVHRAYQKKAIDNPTAVQDRMRIPEFDQVESSTYQRWLTASHISPLVRARVWRNTPVTLKARVYQEARPALLAQARQSGFDLDKAFPPPPGFIAEPTSVEEVREQVTSPTEGVQVERK